MATIMNIRAYKNIHPQLGQRVFVDPSAVVIGRVWLGDDVSVWPTTVIRGDVNDIKIGARTNVQDGSVLHVTSPYPEMPAGIPLIIGEDVTVGHGCILHACSIGDFSLIGMGATILDGAVLEDHVFVGAGAVVTPDKKLTARGLYLGSPARRARDLTDREITELHESSVHYVRLKDEYLAG
jgi:carbonic anhydrase/acetyltransferase-like protein (isoleucine patch superfamily)